MPKRAVNAPMTAGRGRSMSKEKEKPNETNARMSPIECAVRVGDGERSSRICRLIFLTVKGILLSP